MKLFQMDDYETWIGPDLETTKAAYLKYYGGPDGLFSDEEDIEDAGEIRDAELDRHNVDVRDEDEIELGNPPRLVTYRQFIELEVAKGGEFPRFAFGIDA